MTLSSLFSAAAALAAVLGTILLIGRVVRHTKFVGRACPGAGRLGIVESLSLDPRRKLLLVRCDARCVLLLLGQQDQIVGWLPDSAA